MKKNNINNILLFEVIIVTLLVGVSFSFNVSADDNILSDCRISQGQLDRGGLITLDGSCTYHTNVSITLSGTTLDCNGATIEGDGEKNNGIMIIGKGNVIRDVTVKSCHVTGFKNSGIGVSSGIPKEELSTDYEDNYHKSPIDIKIFNSHVEKNGGVGIYIDDYVTNAIIDGSIINDNGGVGIYLEESSRSNKVINNKIINNGYSSSGKKSREGLAIDSSAHNVIEGNEFIGNATGGIYLYKNCSEKYSSGKSVIRWQHSDNNIIENNLFYNEDVGIWIASRQSLNLSKWDCGDKAMDVESKYYEDFANNNTVINNVFCQNKQSIKIEGDNNKITGNKFDGIPEKQISQPVSMREKFLGKKTIGNVINNNSYKKCVI